MISGASTVPDHVRQVDPQPGLAPPPSSRAVVGWAATVVAGVLILAVAIAVVDEYARPGPPGPDHQLAERRAHLDGLAARGDCDALAAEVQSGLEDPGVPATDEHTRTALVIEHALAAMRGIGCPPIDVGALDGSGPLAGTNRVARF